MELRAMSKLIYIINPFQICCDDNGWAKAIIPDEEAGNTDSYISKFQPYKPTETDSVISIGEGAYIYRPHRLIRLRRMSWGDLYHLDGSGTAIWRAKVSKELWGFISAAAEADDESASRDTYDEFPEGFAHHKIQELLHNRSLEAWRARIIEIMEAYQAQGVSTDSIAGMAQSIKSQTRRLWG